MRSSQSQPQTYGGDNRRRRNVPALVDLAAARWSTPRPEAGEFVSVVHGSEPVINARVWIREWLEMLQ